VPSPFPVMSATTHIHQSLQLSTNATSADFVIAFNHGCYRDVVAPNTPLSQIMRAWTSATIIADFTAGFPITNAAQYALPCPLNTIQFAEDVRLVSQSIVFTYTGAPLTGSGALNMAPVQYSLRSNTTIK